MTEKSAPPTYTTAEMDPILELKGELSEYKRLKEVFEERLKFEELLSEISSAYTNLPANEIDQTICSGLARVGKFFGAERANLAQLSEDQTTARILHSWAVEGIEPLPNFLVGSREFYPYALDRLKNAEIIQYGKLEDLPPEAKIDKRTLKKVGTRAQVAVPIAVGGLIVGALGIEMARTDRKWPDGIVHRLQRLGEIFANAVVRKQKELEIQNALAEINKLKDQLEADCSYLREEIEEVYDFDNMIGNSDAMKLVFQKIQQVALTDITVIILGETGTGKELVARAIHAASRRHDRPMVKTNCAALSSSLIETELFGHEKGAFTSAQARQIGRFELAHGNTLLLDEIGELPLDSQAKLLRVLQEGEFERIGSSHTMKVDVRVIAATNRNLEEEVRRGRFRQDLWYRLNIFPITVPPLRQCREDIPLLVNFFATKFGKKLGKTIKRIPKDVMDGLQNYTWPGNIRELENVIERAVLNTQGPSLQILDNFNAPITLNSPHVTLNSQPAPDETLEVVERNHILQVLEDTHWRIYGPKGAAVRLGLNHSTLRFRMKKLGIDRSA